MEAIDRDLGESGRVVYSIEGGNSDRKFRIDEDSGEIYTRRAFDEREENKQYVLLVKATDMGRF